MNENSNPRLERWLARIVGVFVLLFMTYFIASEWPGLVRFFGWLGRGVADLPAAVGNAVAYYQAPPPGVAESLLVGAIGGALLTSLIGLRAAGLLLIPAPSNLALLTALAVIFAGIVFSLGILATVAATIAALLIVMALTQLEFRNAFSGAQFGRIFSRRGARLLALSIALGGGLGALGAQLLVLPMQHCTYAPDLEQPAQYELGLLVTLFGSVVVLVPVWGWLLRKQRRADVGTSGYFRQIWWPYIFLGPMLLNLLLFLYYPSIQTLTLSLRSRVFPLPQERFVCMQNYITLANDIIYQNSFLTTFGITVLVVLLALAISLGIALLASQKIRYAAVYRTLLIWPFALSPVVAGIIFLSMFREGETGLINALLSNFGIAPINWLRTPQGAHATIIIASVWNILGFNILFYVAGLQNIPKDLIEAAQIDGANMLQRFVRITFPLLAPFTFFLLVTNVTYSFYGIYGAVDTLTQGGPPLGPAGAQGGATDVLIYKLYEDAFNPGSPAGLAAAQAVILFVLVAGITIVQFRALESRITYAE